MTTKKSAPQKKERPEKTGGHKTRYLFVGLAAVAVIVMALPFLIKKDALPPELKNNKTMNAYYNRAHGLLNTVDEKIETLHEKAQATSQGQERPAADTHAPAQTGYTEQDREKLDELITKGSSPAMKDTP